MTQPSQFMGPSFDQGCINSDEKVTEGLGLVRLCAKFVLGSIGLADAETTAEAGPS